MSIDWSATGAMLSGIGTVNLAAATAAGAAAVVWTANKAAKTVDGWRKQKIAERKFEHAERTVAAAHNANEALKYVRGAFILGHELSAARAELETRDDWPDVPQGKKKRLETTQAIYARLNNTSAQQDELQACIALARALFGEGLEGAISDLYRQFWITRTWADAYADDYSGRDADFTIKIRRELWSQGCEESQVAKTIRDSLAAVYEVCLPVLQA